MQKELAVNVEDKQINRLCKFDGTSCQVIPFKQARVLDPCLEKLLIFLQYHPSGLFNKLWRTELNKVQRKYGTLTFEDVIKKVWVPVFRQCTEVHRLLMTSKITLAQVDQYFKQYLKDEKKLTKEICSLHLAVQECVGESDATSLKWIEVIISRMQQHWKLSTYAGAAHAFLKIRDTLQLTGNFSLVERVAAQVRVVRCDRC